MAVDTAAALRKLQSGQTLTAEEKAALGIGPAVTPTVVTPTAPDPTKTAYADLTPAQRAAMTTDQKTDYIQAAREAQMAADAAARAESDPMKNFQERPDAPPADENYIYYYSWVGGVNTGSWKLYRAPNTETNAAYKARAVGGETQATASSAVGANALTNQPIVDAQTGVVTTKTPVITSTTKTIKSVTYKGTGKDRIKITTYSDNTTEETPDPETPTSKTVKSITYKGTGKDRIKVTTYSDNTTEETPDPEVVTGKTIVSTSYTGTGANRKRVVKYSDNTTETFDDPDTNSNSNVDTTGMSAETKALIESLQKQITELTNKTNTSAAAQAAADAKAAEEKAAQRLSTVAVLQDRFAKYGLTSLAAKIKELAIDGATEATITLQLQETPEYQTRFSANAQRIKKGLTVLSPAEYLNAEDEYRQRLRDYGLKQFDNDAYVKQFIENDTSLTEISNRIVTAVQRVQNADPAIIKQLKEFYGIDQDRLVAYVLDPEQEFEKIKLQVSSAEIGVEAAKQGFATGKDFAATAEQLAKQGITQAEAQKGYSTIADILPTAEKLSSIYGKTMDTYGQSEAEQEVFNSLASAQRKRKKLSETEIAQFGGSSGLSKGSLLDQSSGQF